MKNLRKYTLEEIGDIHIDLKEVNVNFIGNKSIKMQDFESTYIPKTELTKKCSICGKLKKIYAVVGKTFDVPDNERKATDIAQKGIFHKEFILLCEGCAVIGKI